MTNTDALTRTLDVISRYGWCQEAPARDVHGRETYSHDPNAVQFSIDGALQRVTWPDRAPDPDDPALWHATIESMETLAKCAGMNGEKNAWGYIVKWNDSPGRTREQVEHLIRCAIAKEEG